MMPDSDGLLGLVFNQIWQVTVVAAAAGLLVTVACRRRPHLAYLLGLVVLVKCWVPPLWSSRVGVFCWPSQTTVESLSEMPVEKPRQREMSAVDNQVVKTTVDYKPSPAPRMVVHHNELMAQSQNITLPTLLGSLWLIGATVLSTVVWYQNWRWRNRLGREGVPPGSRLNSLTVELANRLGLRRPPRIMLSAGAVGPAVFGWLRPTIIVPESFSRDADFGRLEIVLAHEMIHIRRGDLTVGVFQLFTQIVWWFHPLIWIMCRQLTRERERCCDEEVMALLRCGPVSYAQCLLDVLRSNRDTLRLLPFPGIRAVEVTRRRFEHILNCGASARRQTPLRYWLFVAVMLCVILPGARSTSGTLGDREQESKSDAREEPMARVPEPVQSKPEPARTSSDEEPPNEPVAVVDGSTPPILAVADNARLDPPSAMDQVIDRGVNFLKAEQRKDGSWPDPVGYPGGITSLCTLALLRSGAAPNAPSVQSALAFLRHIKTQRTYSTALQTMVFCAGDPKTDQQLIRRNVDWLSAQQKQVGPMVGAWAYPEAEGDNSNTGFAVMALYAADQAGVHAPAAIWRRALDYWINNQNANGSWGYKPQTAGTGSMTSQGLFSVAVAAKILDEQKPDQPGPQAIERAAKWLGRNFDNASNPGSRGGAQGWLIYYLHALAQAGRATGREEFGDHDWFVEGTRTLLAEQQTDGSWKGTGHAEDDPHLSTSLALLFLLHGRGKAK